MAEHTEGPGSELRSTRESMDVSLREVADALNLPTHVIEALESDDYDRLPPTVFTRGYLRSYARLLELPPEPLLARYPEVTEEVDMVTGEMPSVSVPARPSLQTLVVGATVAVLLILFLIWWFGDDDEPAPVPVPEVPAEAGQGPEEGDAPAPAVTEQTARPDSAPAGAADVQSASTVPESTLPDPEPADDGAASDATSPPAGPASVTPDPVPVSTSEDPAEPEPVPEPAVDVAGEAAAESAEPAVSPPVVPSRRERRITEFGDDVMTFEFTEDCWVEVKSADGENLYSDLNRAGRTLVLTGRAPFRILLGYAPGVSLQYNGERVPLERYSRNNVANLVLGEP